MGIAQRKALALKDTRYCRVYGAAGHQDLCKFSVRTGAPPLPAAEQSQLPEYAVPMMAAQRVFQPLRPHKRTRPIYETEEREAMYAHSQGLTPSDGRERGKRPRRTVIFDYQAHAP